MTRDLRSDARSIARAALLAVDPFAKVKQALTLSSTEIESAKRVFVLGAGKAAPRMAQAAEAVLGDRIDRGLIVTKRGHALPLTRIETREAGHPVPDHAGVEAARAIALLAENAGPDTFILFLLSGGASALLTLPAEGVALEDKQETTRLLLASGASIHEMNAVRKHLSAIKGGRLAQLVAPARIRALILSDVIGDDLATIGSGPTVPDPSTFADAVRVLKTRNVWARVPAAVRERLEAAPSETPKPGDAAFAHVSNVIIGSNQMALDAGSALARSLGYIVGAVTSELQGEASQSARRLCEQLAHATRPRALISGGETTVTLASNPGLGGRNQEFALAAAQALQNVDNTLVLAFGTDGTDGPTDAAGAFADGTTFARARALGLNPEAALRNHDAYPLFRALGDLFSTGPTGTNVMDIYLLLAA